MSILFLANENFPAPSIRKLKAAGVDVVVVSEAMPSVSDKEVLAFAQKTQRWILTFDRDYGDLIFREGLLSPPAILYFRQEPFPPDHPADLVLAIMSEPQQVLGYMVVITGQGVRRKRFPELHNG